MQLNSQTTTDETTHTSMTVGFWGVRGTLPVPGEKSVRYGGNTNCVTLRLSEKLLFIFDAGTGFKSLSDYFFKKNVFPISAHLMITHPHHDHINGFPFFMPLYMKGNSFDVYGTHHNSQNIEALLAGQMNNVYFPITMNEFSATLRFHPIDVETFNVGDAVVKTMLLNHPGRCLGYRIEHNNKIFCYITDNELYLENAPQYHQHDVDRLIEFIHDADVAIMDCTYEDEEYLRKVGWGHSCVSRVIDVADKAHVKLLCLYHHDPDQTDSDIDTKLAHAQSLLASRHSNTRCIAASEGDRLHL